MDGNNSVDSNNEPRALMGEREKHSRKTRERRENEKAEIFF